jgi:hypothetical protein
VSFIALLWILLFRVVPSIALDTAATKNAEPARSVQAV